MAYLRFSVQSRVFVSAWCSKPWPTFVSAFRAVFSFLHGVQSHCLPSFRRSESYFVSTWRSEPLPIFIPMFKTITSSFGVQNHILSSFRHLEPLFIFYLAFKVVGLVWHSKSSCLSFIQSITIFLHSGVQSHCLPSFRRSKPYFVSAWRSEPLPIIPAFRTITSLFGVQNHILSSFRRLEPLLIFYLAFRVVGLVRHSKSSCLSFVQSITIFLHSGVQSHWAHSFGSFESFLFFSFGFQGHLSYLFRHCESPLSFSLLTFSHFSLVVSFRVIVPDIHVHRHFRPSWFCIHPRSPHFVTLCLSLIHHRSSRSMFHCTWYSPLSSQHVLRSSCWALYTCHFRVVQMG